MNIFEGSIEDCVKTAWDKPEMIQALEAEKYEENAFLAKLLKADSTLYKLLLPKQMGKEAFFAMLENSLEDFRSIPKAKRTDEIKLKALSVDPGAIYLFDKDEVSYECVKFLFMTAPYVLEELDKSWQKAIKPHMAQIKKEKLVSTYSEEEPIVQIDPNDLPDFSDDEK